MKRRTTQFFLFIIGLTFAALLPNFLVAQTTNPKPQINSLNPNSGIPGIQVTSSGNIIPSSCTRTTGTIDANILGIASPPGGATSKDLSYIQDLGVKWVRSDIVWSYLEPTEGVYNWQEWDNVVKAAGGNNIKLLSGIDGIPDWVKQKDRGGRMDAAYNIAKAIAARYKGKVRYYEIGNEPNLPLDGFTDKKGNVDVAVYIDFLSATNRGIHEADPNAVVVLGGLIKPDSPDYGISPAVFMEQLYELGAKDCFDVFNFHPYGYFGQGGLFQKLADDINATLAYYGDAGKPIWFGELGDLPDGQVTIMNQMENEISAVPAWFWFDLRDWGTNKDEQFGLLTLDYQKRPAYDLFKQILTPSAAGNYCTAQKAAPYAAAAKAKAQELGMQLSGSNFLGCDQRNPLNGQLQDSLPPDLTGYDGVIFYNINGVNSDNVVNLPPTPSGFMVEVLQVGGGSNINLKFQNTANLGLYISVAGGGSNVMVTQAPPGTSYEYVLSGGGSNVSVNGQAISPGKGQTPPSPSPTSNILTSLTISPKEYLLGQTVAGSLTVNASQTVKANFRTELFKDSTLVWSRQANDVEIVAGRRDFSLDDIFGFKPIIPNDPFFAGSWKLAVKRVDTAGKELESVSDTFTIKVPILTLSFTFDPKEYSLGDTLQGKGTIANPYPSPVKASFKIELFQSSTSTPKWQREIKDITIPSGTASFTADDLFGLKLVIPNDSSLIGAWKLKITQIGTTPPVSVEAPFTIKGGAPVSYSCTRTTGIIEGNILGINAPPGGLAKEDASYLLDLGVKWMRGGLVGWVFLEPSEGVYDWAESDRVVKWANENNIKLLSWVSGDIPDWVWAKDEKGRQEAVYTMAKTVAARYKGKIRYYEIANEPNLPGFGFFKEGDKVDVGTYLDFLSAANKGVHEVDPNAVVVLGGLSPDGMDPFAFMKQLYELGGKDCFDVFAFHPYGYGGKFKKLADGIQAEMSKYGDSDKPIWFDELGAIGPNEQVTLMNQMKDELSAVPAWSWYELRDDIKDDQTGLLDINYQKRPAYDLFKQILKQKVPPGPYGLLGGANSFCLNAPFTMNQSFKVGTQLGDYKDGYIPQFGPDKEAEVTADSSGIITVKFHPTTPYEDIGSVTGKTGNYWLYVGLMYPYYLIRGNYSFPGCGYSGLTDLPAGQEVHFKGEFKWDSSQSNPPPGSGFGNVLIGGHIAYNFADGAQEILAIDDFGTEPGVNPPSLDNARFYCDPWWHDMQWGDWYNPSKADQWQSFDINLTAVNQKAIRESINCASKNQGRRFDNANSVKIMGLFVGPEYGTKFGTSTFELKNLRMEGSPSPVSSGSWPDTTENVHPWIPVWGAPDPGKTSSQNLLSFIAKQYDVIDNLNRDEVKEAKNINSNAVYLFGTWDLNGIWPYDLGKMLQKYGRDEITKWFYFDDPVKRERDNLVINRGWTRIITNPRFFKNDFANSIKEMMDNYGFDGIWEDIVQNDIREANGEAKGVISITNIGNRLGAPPVWPVYDYLGNAYGSDNTQYQADMAEALSYTRNLTGKLIMINGSGDAELRYADDVNGVMFETMFANDYDGKGGFTDYSGFKMGISAIRLAEKKGLASLVVPIFTGYTDRALPYRERRVDTPEAHKARLFSLASYLFAKGKRTYFYYAPESGYWSGTFFFPEWRIKIGRPTEDCDPVDSCKLSNGLYQRKFSNGLVIINPYDSGGTISMNLPRSLNKVAVQGGNDAQVPSPNTMVGTDPKFLIQDTPGYLTYDTVNSISLGPKEVAILIENKQTPSSAASGKIAFVSRRDGTDHIYLMDSDGTNVAQLTSGSAPDAYPTWSPDGSKIVFNRSEGGAGIYIMNADGSGLKRLSGTPPAKDANPTFSPDGTKILFIRMVRASDFQKGIAPISQMMTMNVDGTNARPIFAADNYYYIEPRWSPDGSKIAFMSNRGSADNANNIFVMNADGTNIQQLTQNQGQNGDPVWSPDGRKISFGSSREGGGRVNIFMMNSDGSGVTQLTHFPAPEEAGDTSWSPDGKKITFQWDKNGNGQSDPNAYAEVWTMNADGTNQASTKHRCSDVGCAPRWQP